MQNVMHAEEFDLGPRTSAEPETSPGACRARSGHRSNAPPPRWRGWLQCGPLAVTERFSKPARRALRAVPQVPYTQLHDLEVPNAFELLVGQTVMTRQECRT